MSDPLFYNDLSIFAIRYFMQAQATNGPARTLGPGSGGMDEADEVKMKQALMGLFSWDPAPPRAGDIYQADESSPEWIEQIEGTKPTLFQLGNTRCLNCQCFSLQLSEPDRS